MKLTSLFLVLHGEISISTLHLLYNQPIRLNCIHHETMESLQKNVTF
jgi:hypothetical protein